MSVDEQTGDKRLLRLVLRNPDLRRLTLSWAALVLAGAGYQIGLLVVAFRDGGQRDVGIALAVQILPPALIGPFTSVLGDRLPRVPLMVSVDAARCVCTAAVAVAVANGGSLALVLLLGAPGALCSTAYGPALRGLLPSLVRDPRELTAANVIESGIEHGGLLIGPGLAGALLTIAGPQWTFAAAATMFAASGAAVAGLRHGRQRPPQSGTPWRTELLAGAAAVRGDRGLRLLTAVYGVFALAGGAVQVFTVVVAHRLAGLGDPGVGELSAAFGAGGLLGTVVVARLATRRRLTSVLACGMALWGGGLLLVGAVRIPKIAFAGLLVIGTANVLGDVALITLAQRAIPPAVLSRVFGVLQSVMALMFVLGAVAAPALVAAAGVRTALVATGCLLPVTLLLSWAGLRRIDADEHDSTERAALLSRIPLFAGLPPATVTALAAALRPLDVPAGRMLIREGEPGDSYYVLAVGTVDVTVAGRHLRTHGAGDGFGELALVRDGRRTATVTARTAARVYVLDREPFLAAVTGHPAAAAAADLLVAARLGSAAVPATG